MTAQALKSVRLEAPSASGKKFYQIQINEVKGGYSVDFCYGAVGDTPRTGTKTPKTVTLEKAEAIFEKLRKEKENGESHYREAGGPTVTMASKPTLSEASTLPTCIAPRLLNDIDEDQILNLVKLDNWWVQIKHDGDRVQLHVNGLAVTLFSGRSAKIRSCPRAIVEACSRSRFAGYVLDGELVDNTFWAFDLLRTDGESTDWLALPYHARYMSLQSIVRAIGCPTIKIVDSAIDEHTKAALIVTAKETSAEGCVFINKNAPYRAGRPNRGGDNLRWKFVASGSFIVAAHNMEKGKQSMDVALYDGTVIGTCSVIGKDLPPLGAIAECRYLYCLDKLVQPRFIRQRTDVPKIACNRRQLKFRQGIDPKGAK